MTRESCQETPYDTSTARNPGEIYGREEVLQKLLDPETKRFVVRAAGRMGVTSLMTALAASVSPQATVICLQLGLLVTDDGLHPDSIAQAIQEEAALAGLTLGLEAGESLIRTLLTLGARSGEGRPIWLLIDEAEYLTQLDDHTLRTIISALRRMDRASISAQAPQLRIVLAGRRSLSQIDAARRTWAGDPFLSYFEPISLGLLDQKAARRVVYRPQTQPPIRCSTRTFQLIMQLTGGHPLLLNALCCQLYEVNQGWVRPPREDDLIPLRGVNGFGLWQLFRQDWEEHSPLEQAILRALVDGPCTTHQLAERCGETITLVEDALYGLRQYGFVRHVKRRWDVAYALLRDWLIHHVGSAESMREVAPQEGSTTWLAEMSAAEVLPFALAVRPKARGGLGLEILHNPEGGEATATTPTAALPQDYPVIGEGLADRAGHTLGHTLFEALFPEEIRVAFSPVWQHARNSQDYVAMQLRFDADDTHLLEMPWELLREHDRYLLRNNILLSRYVATAAPTPRPRLRLPLRVLLVAAQDDTGAGGELGLGEIEGLVVQQLVAPTMAALQGQLEAQAYDIVHLQGPIASDGTLSLTPHLSWAPEALRDVLGHQPPTLVVATAPHAPRSASQAVGGARLATVLLGTPVAAVVAPHATMSPGVIQRFAATFYDQLTKRSSLALALHTARRRLVTMGGAWASPMLFLRSHHDYVGDFLDDGGVKK